MLQIHIAEQHFETALEVLRIRSEKTEGLLNSQEIQIEQFEFDSGKARINAPPQTVFGLRKATDSLYDVFDKALPKLLGEGQALEGFIRRKYKGVKPLRLLVPDDSVRVNIPLFARRWRQRLFFCPAFKISSPTEARLGYV